MLTRDKKCSVQELYNVLTDGLSDETIVIDVRTKGEFKGSHIDGVTNIPLNEIDKRSNELRKYKQVYVHCHNGMRTQEAVKKLSVKGINAILVEGGIVGWRKEGYPVSTGKGGVISIQRQVQITVGTLILLGFGLSQLVNPNFIYISVLMGAGLLFTGISGSCMMAAVLGYFPWNK